MKTALMPTQEVDSEAMATKEDLPNYSEPGTGKTLTAIAAVEKAKLSNGIVVCPTVATLMWTELLAKELGARTQHLRTRETEIDRKADFLIASYGVIADHHEELMKWEFGALIVDEIQYAKSAEAERTQVLFGEECDGTGGLYQQSLKCWGLTGTPVERYSDDLWSQLRAAHPDVLDHYRALSLAEFQAQFCQMQWKEYAGGRVTKYVSVGNNSTRLLNRMLYHDIGIIRRTMEEVEPNMPPVTFREVFTPAKINNELRSLLMGKTEAEIIDALLAGGDAITKARRLMGVAKLVAVTNYIISQASQPLLVGFWHKDVGTSLGERLEKAGVPTAVISGATSPSMRERIRKEYMEGRYRVLLGQIQAMGVAMDGLQHASHRVIVVEDDWSAAKIEQFYKRLARLGQKHPVLVEFCNSGEAVDTAIVKIRERKLTQTREIMNVSRD